MLLRPTRVHEKLGGFYTQNLVAGHFGAYAFAPLYGYVQNLSGFIFPNKDAPKTSPVLDLNPSARLFEGRMQYAPTRVHEKFGGFHIPVSVPAKNAPDFIHPNKDTPKTSPVLYPNP